MAWVCLDDLPSRLGTMYVAGRSQNGNDFDVQVETDNRVRFYIGAGIYTTTTTALQTGVWYQVSATYKAGERIEIYLNAVKEGSTGVNIAVAANPSLFTIGLSPVWGRPWRGRIDQVRLFGRALSATEILGLYRAEYGVLPVVPLRERISQVELCWDTVAGIGYQLQYRSDLTTNLWVPFFTGFLRGTGGPLCTNDAVVVALQALAQRRGKHPAVLAAVGEEDSGAAKSHGRS